MLKVFLFAALLALAVANPEPAPAPKPALVYSSPYVGAPLAYTAGLPVVPGYGGALYTAKYGPAVLG